MVLDNIKPTRIMPFFGHRSPEEIKNYCANETLDSLKKLNQRIGGFLIKQINNKDEYLSIINRLEIELGEAQTSLANIENNNIKIEKSNKNTRDSLCGNGAERWLMLQTIRQPSSTANVKRKIDEIKQEQLEINSKLAWTQKEITACIKEFKIVEQIQQNKLKALQQSNSNYETGVKNHLL